MFGKIPARTLNLSCVISGGGRGTDFSLGMFIINALSHSFFLSVARLDLFRTQDRARLICVSEARSQHSPCAISLPLFFFFLFFPLQCFLIRCWAGRRGLRKRTGRGARLSSRQWCHVRLDDLLFEFIVVVSIEPLFSQYTLARVLFWDLWRAEVEVAELVPDPSRMFELFLRRGVRVQEDYTITKPRCRADWTAGTHVWRCSRPDRVFVASTQSPSVR